jgi:hypothetical protein
MGKQGEGKNYKHVPFLKSTMLQTWVNMEKKIYWNERENVKGWEITIFVKIIFEQRQKIIFW